MSVLPIDNPLIENYLALFDSLSPAEQQIVFTKLSQKRSAGDVSSEEIHAGRLRKECDERTEEERKVAGRKFFDTWKGALKGAPDMTAKEIRAERLERKYGQ